MPIYRPRKGNGKVVSLYLPDTHLDALDRWAKHVNRSRSYAVARIIEGIYTDNQATGKVFFLNPGDRIPNSNAKERNEP